MCLNSGIQCHILAMKIRQPHSHFDHIQPKHTFWHNFLPQILTKTGSPLSVLLSDLNCVLQHVCELWVIEVRMWVARVLTVNTGVIARCHPALDRDARMQRGETGIHWALQYEISHISHRDMRYEICWCVRLCSLQIFLKWCAAEQHWDKVCNFGKYFELWKDKTILQYYLYHSYNCTMSSNNTSAVKSTSHHLQLCCSQCFIPIFRKSRIIPRHHSYI